MGIGIALGLTAALCWGVADFLARGASRTGGTFLTLLYIQIVASAALLAIGLPTGLVRLSGQSPPIVLAAAAINLAIMGGAALLYRAFAVGAIALVSPIAASFAAITALLALATGERPTAPQLAGIVLTLAGVILASTVPGHPSQSPTAPPELADIMEDAGKRSTGSRRLAPGLVEALSSMLVFGVAYWALRYVVGPVGGVTVAFIGKASDLAALSLLGLVATLLARRGVSTRAATFRLTRVPERRFLLFAVPTALLDTTANAAYNVGVTHALTALVSVISSLFSAVTVLLAWLFLGERLTRWQWLGVLAIFAGIALVSV